MCGIAGYVSRTGLDDCGRLAAMGQALAHRGPDAAGCMRLRADGECAADAEPALVGLAHRRLSIIDLSEAGRQPMTNEDGRLWLTYNGECYNYSDHGADLRARGHHIRTRTDTEIILHLYEEHGLEGALKRMNGMFAFALWDHRERALWLACDRLGKKPLYYVHQPDGTFFFASEIKSLIAARCFDRERLNPVAWHDLWMVNGAVGERTIYSQVHRLRPGHFVKWHDGQIDIQPYWRLHFGSDPFQNRSLDDLADELESLLRDAIRLRLVSDVPVGVFLSAGVDSALVTALTQRVQGQRCRAFTIGFAQPEFDESDAAAAIARHLRVEHQTLKLRGDNAPDAERVARHFDEPFGDSSILPTWAVAQLAREHVAVALTGDGGDELFAGYEGFRQGLRIWGNADERAPFLRPLTPGERFWEWRLRRLGFERGFLRLDSRLPRHRRKRLFTQELLRELPTADLDCQRNRWIACGPNGNLRGLLQHMTLHTWLPDIFLRKVDMASMAHALECRAPLLDYRVAEFAARLPWHACYDAQGRGKILLRHLLARFLPAELVGSVKRGFGVPWEQWCRGERGAALRARWRRVATPWFHPDAADWLYPAQGPISNYLSWNAFATTIFLEGQTGRAL